jgi:hypothetical protein
MKYRVLIDCVNDATGKRYKPGAVVTTADFPQAVINAWVKNSPPVLEVIDDGS